MDIICHLPHPNVSKDCMGLINYYTRDAFPLMKGTRYTEYLISLTTLGEDQVVPDLETGIIFWCLQDYLKQAILFVAIMDALQHSVIPMHGLNGMCISSRVTSPTWG